MQHQHGGVGQVHAALHQAAGGNDAAEHDRNRNDRQRVLAGEERDENAGEAVAGGQRRVGAALDGGDFEKAGEPGAGAGNGGAGDDQPADGKSLRQSGARIAAGDPRSEAERRARHQDMQQNGDDDANGQAPMHVGAGNLADHIGLTDRHGRGLVGIGEVAQHAFDEEVHDGDADIGQQQRGDRLVDAAGVAQIADNADPERADDHAGDRHHGERDERRRLVEHQRDRDHRGDEAAEHQRALAADHDEADARRHRDGERGEDQRRRALQRVLQRKGGAEAAALHELEELDRRLCRAPAGTARTAARRRSARTAEWRCIPPPGGCGSKGHWGPSRRR